MTTNDLKAQIAHLQRDIDFMCERENLLNQINEATRIATDAAQITHRAASLLGSHLRVNRCAYAEVDEDQNNLTVIGNSTEGLPSMIGRYTLRQFSSSAFDLL